MDYSDVVDLVGRIIDILGVSAIVLGIVFSLMQFVVNLFRPGKQLSLYGVLRQKLGKTIIIGLELLIAGDIIRSIAVPPSFENVGVLALIVLIRAFLSIQIENGAHWQLPWQSVKEKE